jgi:hypothetical protein
MEYKIQTSKSRETGVKMKDLILKALASEGPKSAHQVADLLGEDAESVKFVLDALVEVGVVVKNGRRYRWQVSKSWLDTQSQDEGEMNDTTGGETDEIQIPDWFIRHNGGDIPVNPDAAVDIVFRNGSVWLGSSYPKFKNSAKYYMWRHRGVDSDIVAYRVVDIPEESEPDADDEPEQEIPYGFTRYDGGEIPISSGVYADLFLTNGFTVNTDTFPEKCWWTNSDYANVLA